jgi:hypothetical protein
MALAIGATGAGTTPLIGSTTGDLLAAVPILIGLYFLLRGVDAAAVSPRTAWRDLMLAGGFAGLGVGSKLTMASYGVAMAAALLVLPRCVLVRGLARFLAASVVGGLVTGGYHHLRMLRLFGNPLFPMMNNVFQSPYWEHDTLRVTGFPPKTLFDTMFYPFEWAINSQYGIVSELAFRDIRIALTMSLGVLVLVKWGLGLPFGRRIASTVPSSIRALVIFGLVAYIIWLPLFSIYRYLLPLEMLSGVFIVLALAALARQAVLTVAAAGAAFACIATTVPLEWGHGAFGDRYVEVSAPVLPPDTVVVLVGDEPVSYLIPFMGLDTIWLGLSNNFLRPDQRNLLVRREHDLISSHKDRLMVLKTGAPPDLHSAVLSAFDLAVDNGNCKSIYSNLNSQPYQLCPVVARSKDDGLH